MILYYITFHGHVTAVGNQQHIPSWLVWCTVNKKSTNFGIRHTWVPVPSQPLIFLISWKLRFLKIKQGPKYLDLCIWPLALQVLDHFPLIWHLLENLYLSITQNNRTFLCMFLHLCEWHPVLVAQVWCHSLIYFFLTQSVNKSCQVHIQIYPEFEHLSPYSLPPLWSRSPLSLAWLAFYWPFSLLLSPYYQ